MSEPVWMFVAKGYIGLAEGPGAANNPRVVEMFAKSGFPNVKQDEVPWCAAYVGAVLSDVGLVGTKSLGSRTYEKWGQKLNSPVYGCIGVMKRFNESGRDVGLGHVGFVVAADSDRIWLLGGNTRDMVKVAAFPRRMFTAYRWPTGFPLPTSPLPSTYAENVGFNPKVT